MSVKPAAVTDINGDDKVRGSENEQENKFKMFGVGRDLYIVFGVIILTFAVNLIHSYNTSSNNGKLPPPSPFFRSDSPVQDFYDGNLNHLMNKKNFEDMMFVMHYAPWDAESQNLKEQFEIAAEYFKNKVYFAAVNCWQPKSHCSRMAKKIPIHSYPVFYAYPNGFPPIEYKGHRLAGHMIKFVNTLIEPIKRIMDVDDYKRLRIRYDVLIVGAYEFTKLKSKWGTFYKVLYETAMSHHEISIKNIGFAVITNVNVAGQLRIKYTPSISMHVYHGAKYYLGDCKSKAISEWISKESDLLTTWLSPSASKNINTLKFYVDDSPILILLTPNNPLLSHNNNYDILREVVLNYYECGINDDLTFVRQLFSSFRIDINAEEEKLYAACQRKKKNILLENGLFDIPIKLVDNVWINASSHNLKSRKNIISKESFQCDTASWPNSEDYEFYTLDRILLNLKPDRMLNSTVDETPVDKSKLRAIRERTIEHLKILDLIKRCRQYFHAKSFEIPTDYYTKGIEPSSINPEIVGIGCKVNTSLTFIAMDSNIYKDFAINLGVELNGYTDRTTALIFTGYDEALYLMDKPYTSKNLQEFILNHIKGKLKRHLRSESRASLPLNRYKNHQLEENDSENPTSVSLVELTSHTFHKVALNESQNVVVFFHTPYCAFCHTMSHVYLTVAHQLRRVKNLIFTRIDGENNDLPWEFTVHHYPAILVLPAYRKADSRVFPQMLPITIENLSKFVLVNLNTEIKLQGMIELCSQWSHKQFTKKQAKCFLDVRIECSNIIGRTLKEYRIKLITLAKSKLKQKTLHQLLRKLEFFKQLHLQLSLGNISKASFLLNKFSINFLNVDNVNVFLKNYKKMNILIKDEL